jgi:hypothetical protein
LNPTKKTMMLLLLLLLLLPFNNSMPTSMV